MTTKDDDAIEAAGPGRAYDDNEERAGRRFTVHHDGVTIPVSRGGRGRPLVLVPGLMSTQADLHELIELLRLDHDVVTFDLRGHGLSSAGDRYTFEAFLGDLVAVMSEIAASEPGRAVPPILVGYSLGADLAVHYAAEHPDAVAELVIIDGANPLPEPFITEIDLPEFRAMAEDPTTRREIEQAIGTPRQVLPTAKEIFDLQLQIDVVRSRILDRFRKVTCPITMIMSTSIAGTGTDGRTPRHNHLWRTGIARLLHEPPPTPTVTWLPTNHRLVFTHAREIAQLIQTSPTQAPAPAPAPAPRTAP
ncbi:alpha/beta fold hydrolase [Embleya sp. NPDC020886]|uniref:alpha/beta fold hydrolase n=1 Tax=Embleya sp. NPDC020886 TaxID=3363980 RepID=UPI0037BAF1B8